MQFELGELDRSAVKTTCVRPQTAHCNVYQYKDHTDDCVSLEQVLLEQMKRRIGALINVPGLIFHQHMIHWTMVE